MRKEKWGCRGGWEKILLCWLGIGVRFFPQRLVERERPTQTHILSEHIDVYSWFSFWNVKKKKKATSCF